jgi:hypothetical protein
MKKLLTFVIVVGLLVGGGYLAYKYLLSPGDSRACHRLADLCGGQMAGDSLQSCTDLFDKLRQATGDERADKTIGCVQQSQSCMAAMGCLTGAGVGAGIEAASEFLRGLRNSLKDR